MTGFSKRKTISQKAPPITAGEVSRWIKITKTYSDFSTAGLTNDIEIYSLPAKGIIQSCVIKHTTLFTGGLIATYTASVGINGNLVKYAATLNVLQAVGNTTFGLGAAIVPTVENFGAATSIRGSVVSTVGLLNAATQGSVDFYLLVSTLP
jgi:hypothetical protein